MNNKIIVVFFFVFLWIKSDVLGQRTNNYWYFGIGAGLYFDSTKAFHPVTGKISAAEGASSISDGCGLLFYTDGDTVWNKNHVMMSNGFDIGGKCAKFHRSSSTQAAIIVRQPGSDSMFYIFTTDCVEDSLVNGLSYSIVNMNKNAGLGAVILKDQRLLAFSEEKLTASRHTNGCDIWIITHQFTSNKFYSYLLTSSGLSLTPVISSAGQVHNCGPKYSPHGRGYLKASPNGKLLINVNPDGVYYYCDTTLPELFKFNQSTGVVSSDFVFPMHKDHWWISYSSWAVPFYGATFSPDNTKLYLSSGFYGPNLYQYDLSAGSPSAIIASQVYLSTPYPYPSPLKNIPTSLVNAPDGKIYIAQRYKNYLGVINKPNMLGLACNYVDSAVTLATGTSNDWGGLPNFFEDYINDKLLKANFDFTASSSGSTIFFTNKSVDSKSYIWYFGDGSKSTLKDPNHTYTDTGFYTVSLFAKDSFCNVDRICKTIYIAQPTTISESYQTKEYSIFPNPFTDKLTVNSNSSLKLELIIYDLFARKMIQREFTNSISINTEQLSKGIYFFELRDNNKNTAEKGVVLKQ